MSENKAEGKDRKQKGKKNAGPLKYWLSLKAVKIILIIIVIALLLLGIGKFRRAGDTVGSHDGNQYD